MLHRAYAVKRIPATKKKLSAHCGLVVGAMKRLCMSCYIGNSHTCMLYMQHHAVQFISLIKLDKLPRCGRVRRNTCCLASRCTAGGHAACCQAKETDSYCSSKLAASSMHTALACLYICPSGPLTENTYTEHCSAWHMPTCQDSLQMSRRMAIGHPNRTNPPMELCSVSCAGKAGYLNRHIQPTLR